MVGNTYSLRGLRPRLDCPFRPSVSAVFQAVLRCRFERNCHSRLFTAPFGIDCRRSNQDEGQSVLHTASPRKKEKAFQTAMQNAGRSVWDVWRGENLQTRKISHYDLRKG